MEKPTSFTEELFVSDVNRVFGYIRTSTVMQAVTHSIKHQKKGITSFCEKNDLTLNKIYFDLAKSGSSLKGREALGQLLEELKEGDTLITVELSRLARNLELGQNLFSIFKEKAIKLIVLNSTDVDFFTLEGELIFMKMMEFFEEERLITSQRVKNAVSKLKEDGNLKSRSRYGYRSPGHKLPLLSVSEEIEVIELIRSLKNESPQLSAKQIALILTERGIPPPFQSKQWWDKSVRNIMMQNDIIPKVEKKPRDKKGEENIIEVLKSWIEKDPTISITEMTKKLNENFEPINRATKWHKTAVKNLVEKNKLRESKLETAKALMKVLTT